MGFPVPAPVAGQTVCRSTADGGCVRSGLDTTLTVTLPLIITDPLPARDRPATLAAGPDRDGRRYHCDGCFGSGSA